MNLKRLTSVSLGHLTIDILNSSVAMIITVLAVPFGLTNSQIGLGVMTYALVGSLSQPFFGWLADRLSGRWLCAAGLFWTASFYAIATYADNYPTLLFFMSLAALGSGAFHPQGAMVASDAGRARASSSTAIFFLLGQTGLALGPIIAGLVLEHLGLAGVRTVAIAALPVVLLMAIGLYHPIRPMAVVGSATGSTNGFTASVDRRLTVLVAFGLVVALRATVQQSYYGLLPKFFADQGFAPGDYGFLVGIFSIALAVGTLAGGILGDSIEHRKLLIWALLITAPFTYAMLFVHGWSYYLLATVAGFLVGVPHSVLVVMAQKLLPRRQGLASGAVLGFMFATGAVGTGLAGWLADFTGMAAALQIVSLLNIGAGISAYFLARQPQPQRAAVASAAPGDD
jgi:MFS transporter, FSR family, fosmidomycin resistance protein